MVTADRDGLWLPYEVMGAFIQLSFSNLHLGYNYSFPFLSPKVKVDVSSHRLSPLHKHLISIHHPTLSFLGICSVICPFPQFHQQAALVRRFLDGSYKLPSVEVMLKEEADDLQFR